MEIKINLYKDVEAEPIERKVEAGTSIESLLREYRSHLPYPIMTARINNEDVSLNTKIEEPCSVTFCDIKQDVANRAFQRGLCLLYLKAVRDLFEDAQVRVLHSIDRGLYTTIEKGSRITNRELALIEKRMWEIVDNNSPIIRTTVGKKLLLEYLKENSSKEKYQLMENSPDLHQISVCELDGYTNYFYGLLVPSTRYITPFALELYHEGVLLRFPHPSGPNIIADYRIDDKIFLAIDEERKVLSSLGLSYIADLCSSIASGNAEKIIKLCEDFHKNKIEQIAEKIVKDGERLVLVAGPSSSGKTTFSKRLIMAIEKLGKKCLYLGTDDYFVEREYSPRDEKGNFDYEGLNALDVDLFQSDIKGLLAGEEVDIPTYNFIDGHKEFGERKTTICEDEIILIEGIHALNAKLTEDVEERTKFKVYISPLTQLNIDDHNRVPPTDVRLLRRMLRDSRTRGNSIRETIKNWPKVRAGETVNIFPYNHEADVVFNSTLVYELPVIRKYAEPLLKKIGPEDPEYGKAKWLLYFLRFFTIIEDESAIPGDSILREFIGGSDIHG